MDWKRKKKDSFCWYEWSNSDDINRFSPRNSIYSWWYRCYCRFQCGETRFHVQCRFDINTNNTPSLSLCIRIIFRCSFEYTLLYHGGIFFCVLFSFYFMRHPLPPLTVVERCTKTLYMNVYCIYNQHIYIYVNIHNVICPVFFPSTLELVKAGWSRRLFIHLSKPSLAATGEINQTTPGTAILNIHYIMLRHATPLQFSVDLSSRSLCFCYLVLHNISHKFCNIDWIVCS